MSTSPGPTMPYERQLDSGNNRLCGAASLSMIYRSFGEVVPQAEIWPRISRLDRLGDGASATYLMAQDALNRGFVALPIQARYPLQVLRLCQDKGIRVVLNHRLQEGSATGHYSVLVDIDGESAVLHDPYFGPARHIPHAALLDLWLPHYPNAEITGNVLIGIAAQPSDVPPCQLCGSVIPPHVDCPNCRKPVVLQPAMLLGCVGASCAGKMWNYICCPFCDYTWTFGMEPLEGQQAASGSTEDPWNLGRLFQELDKFCDHVQSLPAVADRADVRQQLDFIRASKDKLKLAQAEEFVHRKLNQARLTQLQQMAQQQEEAFLKKQEEINKPAPASDGNALGQALLKDLGLLT